MPTTDQMSAAPGGVVWVFFTEGFLFRSNDRGDTWVERALPPQSVSPRGNVTFIDGQRGWLNSSGSPETECNAEGTAIWQTTDGAASWQQVAVVDGVAPSTSGIADAQCKENLSFVDPTHGFLAAWDDNHQPTIYRTSDAGHTWKGANLPDPPGFVTQGGGFSLRAGVVRGFDTTLLVPATGMNAASGQLSTYVYRSVDGGATWTDLGTLPNPGGSIGFVTATRWLQIVEPDQSSETTDAGSTWHSYATDYSQAAPIAPEVVFGDPLVGYATVRGGIQRTTDGGANWAFINTPGTLQSG
ncbi:MAG TPA: sialidase family protein [Candidatus Acidoferrum sp.]|jgi:photosystem II stability/assembly factor-like uncharacterized protein|nr:sialidase family protein [Candidatus Acidoferrum sp.]